MLTAQIESFTERLDELKPLLPLHWEELALNKDAVPLDPQYDIYIEREKRGEVLFVTLREEGALVGYFIGFIAPGLHYKTCLTMIMDIFYLHKDHRGKRGGIVLFKAMEAECKRRGVNRLFVGSKVHKPAAKLFQLMDYNLVEETYSKWLGN